MNQWHPKLPEVICAAESIADEVLLGINGSFHPDHYPVLFQFKKLRFEFLQWQGYGKTKNAIASLAQFDWILSIDVDEVLSPQLCAAIKEAELNQFNVIYSFGMLHFLGEQPIRFGEWGRGKQKFLRLYHKGFTVWGEQEVHEQLILPPNGVVKKLKGKVYHYTAKDERELLLKSAYYADLSLEKYRRQNKRFWLIRRFCSSIFRFLKEYIFYAGFLDGKAGYQVAKANAYYTYWKYGGLKDISAIKKFKK